MKRFIFFISLCVASFLSIQAQHKPIALNTDDLNGYNILIANDLGRNGYYDQKTIAAQMGLWADKADIEFVAVPGDIHHFNGVASVQDPLWMTNYELIYNHPGLMLDWYAVCGNHEYRGNTQAVVDYKKISRRWVMPSKYYTLARTAEDGSTIRYVFLDTPPMMDKYRNNPEEYPDAMKEDYQKQLHFLDSVLTVSKETWKVVFGHHPVYAQTTKEVSERKDMQDRLDPILRKHKVDFYINGHIHNFQHIEMKDSPVEYFTNSSASGARKVSAIEGTKFCSSASGFSILSANKKRLGIYFIDKAGNCIYKYQKAK